MSEKPKITQKAVRAAMAFIDGYVVPEDYFVMSSKQQEASRMAAVRGALLAAALADAA